MEQPLIECKSVLVNYFRPAEDRRGWSLRHQLGSWAASRSASERRMQNSLPSGSASTTQPVPGPQLPRVSSTSVAPCSSSRASSSSRVPARGRRSKWMPASRQLLVRDLDEQQPVAGLGVADHALLVAGLVGVVLDVDVAEHRLPPLRELVGVVAVDGRVRDEGGHRVTVYGQDLPLKAFRPGDAGRLRARIRPGYPKLGYSRGQTRTSPTTPSLIGGEADSSDRWGIVRRGPLRHVRWPPPPGRGGFAVYLSLSDRPTAEARPRETGCEAQASGARGRHARASSACSPTSHRSRSRRSCRST